MSLKYKLIGLIDLPGIQYFPKGRAVYFLKTKLSGIKNIVLYIRRTAICKKKKYIKTLE